METLNIKTLIINYLFILYSFSEEEGADTTDSLDIKPPQAVKRHHKINVSRRRDKHVEKRDRKDEKERKSRHHDRVDDKHRDKHRHRRHDVESMERSERSEGSKRERERIDRMERIDGHSRDRESSRHERKDRTTGDRVLEDLRERYLFILRMYKEIYLNKIIMCLFYFAIFILRLLDKRRERREDPREIRDCRREIRLEESRDRRDARLEEIRERHELRTMDDGRERRELRIDDRRHIRMMEEQYSEADLIDRPEKRHKRSHKHERTRDREREKVDRENHMKNMLEMSNPDDQEGMEVSEILLMPKEPKEMTEQELRKERYN